MEAHRVTHLFAMAPPSIRANLTHLLSQVGLRAVYYDESAYFEQTGWKSSTMLSMLEVTIAVGAGGYDAADDVELLMLEESGGAFDAGGAESAFVRGQWGGAGRPLGVRGVGTRLLALF